MARASSEPPFWAAETFDLFNQFGYTGITPAFKVFDSVTFSIMLQPLDECSEYKPCREALLRRAAEAIAFAEERFTVKEFEFKMTFSSGYPLEAKLELTITDKKGDEQS